MTDRPLRTIIVDDEALAVERLAILCRNMTGVEVIAQTTDPETALKLIATLSPDLILLDIAMPEIDGLAIARAAERIARRPAIVFCTAFERFAVEAFEIAALDYLLKPVAASRLARAVDRARRALASTSVQAGERERAQEFWVSHRQQLIRICANQIERIEADRDYMRLQVGGRTYLLRSTIGRLLERLDPDRFLQIHRSHVVRRDFVATLDHDGAGCWHAVLADGTRLRIGRSHLGAVRHMIRSDSAGELAGGTATR